jgi:hypothetical protein
VGKERAFTPQNAEAFLKAYREALDTREEWTAQASCSGLWEYFDADYKQELGEGANDTHAMMKQICAKCPVLEQCLNDTLLYSDEYGFRAGMFPKERKALMKRLGTMSWEAKQKVLRGYAPKKQARA